jgi:hypothetical protein
MPRAALPRYQEGNPATDILAQRPRADSAEAAGAFAVVGGGRLQKRTCGLAKGNVGHSPHTSGSHCRGVTWPRRAGPLHDAIRRDGRS